MQPQQFDLAILGGGLAGGLVGEGEGLVEVGGAEVLKAGEAGDVGRELVAETTITGPQLSKPIHYKLVYSPAR